jgi:hypothetical protein
MARQLLLTTLYPEQIGHPLFIDTRVLGEDNHT